MGVKIVKVKCKLWKANPRLMNWNIDELKTKQKVYSGISKDFFLLSDTLLRSCSCTVNLAQWLGVIWLQVSSAVDKFSPFQRVDIISSQIP